MPVMPGGRITLHRASMRRLVDYAYRGNLAGILDPHHEHIASITTPGQRPQHRNLSRGTVLVAVHRDGGVHAYRWSHAEPRPLPIKPEMQREPWPRGALERVGPVLNREGQPMTILDFGDYIDLPTPPEPEKPGPPRPRGHGRLDTYA